MIILKSVIFLFFLVFASIGWGKIALHLVKEKFTREDLPFIVYPALGFGIISYLSLIAGLAGFFNTLTLFLIYLIGFLLSITVIRYYMKELTAAVRKLWSDSARYKCVLALFFLVITIIFIKTLSPPANINDSLAYHLYCPKVFLQNHRVFAIPYDIDCAMPFLMEMLFAFGIALKEPIFAKLITYLMGLMLIFAIVDFSKKYISERYAIFASLVFILTPIVYVHMSYAYVELGLAFYLFMSFYMFYEWLRKDNTLFLVLSGIFIGFALSIKVLAGFLVPAFFIYIIMRVVVKRRGFRSLLKNLFLFGVFIFVFSFVWYLRSYIIFGNPVFPYLNSVFSDQSLGLIGDQSHHGLGRGTDFLSFLRLPWDLTYFPDFFGGDRINPIFLGTFPLVFMAIRHKEFLRICFFIMVFLVFWFLSYQRTRFLMPMFPFVIVAWTYLISKIAVKPWRVVKVVLFSFISLFLCLETGALIYNTRDRIAVALGAESKHDYLHREERTYGIATYINKHLPRNAKILAFETRLFYFDREIVREDIFRLLTKYDKMRFGKDGLIKLLKKDGFTHILCGKNSANYKPQLRQVLEKDTTPVHAEDGYYLYQLQ